MIEKQGIVRSSSHGAYNKCDDTQQWIRLSDGCPNGCPFCYESGDLTWHGVPEIVRNDVHIMDMNILAHKETQDTIEKLCYMSVNDKRVAYTLECGIDYRYLDDKIAWWLHEARFYDMRMAWDFHYIDQKKIKTALQMLCRAGYKPRNIMIFMVCNWEIPFDECMLKLNLCKYWNVQVADCYFDGQISPNIKPIGWTAEQIKTFRRNVRKHNQIVNFGIDPELKS